MVDFDLKGADACIPDSQIRAVMTVMRRMSENRKQTICQSSLGLSGRWGHDIGGSMSDG